MTDFPADPHRAVAEAFHAARPLSEGPAAPFAAAAEPDALPEEMPDHFADYDHDLEDDAGPADTGAEPVDRDMLSFCAGLDQSDTDNGKRLIAHFGKDLAVLQQEGARSPDYIVWCGTHWDMAGGNDAALRVAQKIGGLIGMEADMLSATPSEQKAIEAAGRAANDLERLEKIGRDKWTDEHKRQARDLQAKIDDGDDAKAELKKRKVARRKFGVSSKNKARLDAMLACAAPHLLRAPDAFNAAPLAVAVNTHTLVFGRIEDEESDPDDPRWRGHVEAVPGHRREDLITKLVPVDYDREARCPKWDAFLRRFQPDEQQRRMVQVFSGLGLTGIPLQKLLFHYGLGANGKSVFMETLARLFGPLAVGLPAESITGQNDRGGGQASPDLARLYGARYVRVSELPPGKLVQEELIKKLTGGEKIPVRSLFKGYFDFQPVFKAHMSGNGFPTIDGTDNGIWRRLVVVHWPVTLLDHEQREFEEVLAEFRAEYSGILNWLIEGVRIFLTEGFVMPASVQEETQAYRDEMDDIGEFVRACVVARENANVPASSMYEAYVSWCMANARRPRTLSKFGRVMKTKLHRDDSGSVRLYRNCALEGVPARPEPPRNPYSDER